MVNNDLADVVTYTSMIDAAGKNGALARALEVFNEAQKTGKIVVINSWNKFCGTCAKQTEILNEAKKDFPNVIFLSYEHSKNKDIAKLLKSEYWATIIICCR